MPLKLKVVGRSDKGLVRAGNEDSLHIDYEHNVYAVCDGMGGHLGGEVASMTASETLSLAFNEYQHGLLQDPALGLHMVIPSTGEILVKAIRLANRHIYEKAKDNQTLHRMGTTVVAMVFEADVVSIAHVGDSRAYRLEEKHLEPLTRDHSWVNELSEAKNISLEEASAMAGKNIITRALGVNETVEVDYCAFKVKPDDIFIMCSDGLCGYADDDEIFEVAQKHRADTAKMVDALIDMANDRGGSDNVTVIAISVQEVISSPLNEHGVMTVPGESPTALEAENRWLEKIRLRLEELSAHAEEVAAEKPVNKILLAGIFVVFAAVAVVIWLSSRSH